MTIQCPIVVTVTAPTTEPPTFCYKGFKVYTPGNSPTIPEWEGQPYRNYYLVFMSNLPVIAGNINWRAANSVNAIKQTIDSWSSGSQGGQC